MYQRVWCRSGSRGLIVIALISSLTILPLQAAAPAKAKPKAAGLKTAHVEPAVCASLMADYELASKKLAVSGAEDVIDDSAPRSTMREAQNNNVIAQANMTMQIMTANGCNLPAFSSSASRYGLASLKCSSAIQHNRTADAMDRLQGTRTFRGRPPECDIENWKPDEDVRAPSASDSSF